MDPNQVADEVMIGYNSEIAEKIGDKGCLGPKVSTNKLMEDCNESLQTSTEPRD